jgi:4,5-DOPA dioxygenase extradiol
VLVHASPTPPSPSCSSASTPTSPSITTSSSGPSSPRCAGEGVLVVGSGDVVHNLRAMDWGLTDDGYDWAQRFSDDSRERMLTDPTEFAALDAHADFDRAVPTPDHFIPAIYFAGLAGASSDPDIEGPRRRIRNGSLSMTAYTLGAACPETPEGAGAPRPPRELPPDASNIQGCAGGWSARAPGTPPRPPNPFPPSRRRSGWAPWCRARAWPRGAVPGTTTRIRRSVVGDNAVVGGSGHPQ